MARNLRKESGFLLPSTLLIIALLAIVISLSDRLRRETSILHRSWILSENSFNTAANELIRSLLGSGFDEELYCISKSSRTGDVEVTLSGCSIGDSKNVIIERPISSDLDPQDFPHIDYTRYLQNLIRCPENLGNTPKRTFSGESLSEASVRSLFACRVSDSFPENAVGGDLEVQSSVSPASLPTSVVATGYINFAVEQEISRPLIILGFGDVQIAGLRAVKPVPITVVSQTGNVTIRNVVGPILLKIIARGNVTLPVHVSGDNGLYPNLRKRTVMGLEIND